MPVQSAPSVLPEQPADKLALLEELDGFAPLRNRMRDIARELGDYAGIPMPLQGHQLVIEPTYPKAKELAAIGAPEDDDRPEPTVRNRWWSDRKKGDIFIFQDHGSEKIEWVVLHGVNHIDMDLHTFDCADVWGIEQEANAINTLGTLIRHRQFKQYMLTGMFVETSKRSGVMYIFRRLRPTIAVRVGAEAQRSRILACLCMHPIAYYAGTWAGAMCPTDDVIAHLMLMRGDEKMFWRRSNQIAPWRPEAGL